MKNNSLVLQTTNSIRKSISKFFSSYLTNWIGGYYILAVIFPPKRKRETETKITYYNPKITFLRYYLIWSIPYSIAIFEKPLWARGRPFYICKEVEAWSCSCSFGMPSSHSCTGVSVYFTLFSIFYDCFKNKKSIGCIIFGIFCSFLAFGIGVSRIVLGSHSFNQVLIGLTMGIVAILILEQEKFDYFIKEKILKKGLAIWVALSYFLITVVISLIGYGVNKGDTRRRSFWIERKECPNCLDNLVYYQMDNNTHYLLTAGYLFGFALNYKYFGNERVEEEIEVDRGNSPGGRNVKKYIIRAITFLILIGILGLVYLAWSKMFNLKTPVLRFFLVGFLLMFHGFSSMFLVQVIWRKVGVEIEDVDYVVS